MPFKPDPITGGVKQESGKFKPDPIQEFEAGLGEKAGAVAYGAGTGAIGSLGELEKFGAYTVPEMLGFREEDQKDQFMGRETLFPTTEEARQMASKVGIKRPKEEVRSYETGGELLGGLATGATSGLKTGVKTLLGTPTRVRALNAAKAERLGFKLSPAQVRADEPISAKGASGFVDSNQTLANKLASEGTGKSTTNLRPEFIAERLKTLGKEYDNLYKGNQFKIDSEAVSALQNIAAKEAPLPNVATVSPVYQTALSILDRIKAEGMVISGDDLQRMRNALTESARRGSRSDAHEIYDFVNVIDNSVGKYQPELKAKLSELNPKYRNSIILEDLYRAGGIEGGDISLERLGTMLKGGRDVVRGGKSDIDSLAKLGSELGLRARWEKEGKRGTDAAEALSSALSTKMAFIPKTLGLRSATARKAQKALARKPVTAKERLGMTAATGEVGGAMFEQEE